MDFGENRRQFWERSLGRSKKIENWSIPTVCMSTFLNLHTVFSNFVAMIFSRLVATRELDTEHSRSIVFGGVRSPIRRIS